MVHVASPREFMTWRDTVRPKRKKKETSELEINTIMREVEKHQVMLFGSIKSHIKRSPKNHVWKMITSAVNSVSVKNKTSPVSVIHQYKCIFIYSFVM